MVGFALWEVCRNACYHYIIYYGVIFLILIPAERDALRYEILLKLFFVNEAGALQAISHIDAFQEKIEGELPYLIGAANTLRNNFDVDDTHKYYLLTVEFGMKAYRAYLEWCEEAKKILGEASK